jgi:DNA-binding response OmpR family regulator
MSGETILLVEDHDAVALGLEFALSQEGFNVIRAATAAQARKSVIDFVPDMIILDIRLPDGSGYDLCRDYRAAGMRQPILMLTARDETIDKVIGLELGADEYVTKPFVLDELFARIRSLLRRSYGALVSNAPSRIVMENLNIDLAGQRVTQGQKTVHLTATEFKILAKLATNAGRPIDREEFLQSVWGYAENVGDGRTVDVHIRNLRRKLELDPSRPKIILTVRGQGYMLAAK